MRHSTKMASLESWNNDPTPATPDGVAGVFASSVLARQFPRLHPLSLEVLRVFRDGEAAAAKKLAEDAPRTEFCSGQEYLAWAQFKGFLLKAPLKGTEGRCKAAAVKKFLAAEMACKRANRRLRWYWSRSDREHDLYRVILSRTRQLISQVLGTFTEATLEQLLDLSRPGGGSAVGTKNPLLVSLPWKLSTATTLTCTPDSLVYAKRLVEESPAWSEIHADQLEPGMDVPSVTYVVTNTNRVAFVPKDATTHRTIAVEPHLNICLQLGADQYLKSRLKAYGVDLRSQSQNQRFARKGALAWEQVDPLVTLDLAAASDSLCRGLVERLLPSTWFGYLDDIRSKFYVLSGGNPVEYQKWSSMGNGYTFSLETLIFWALAKVCSSFTSSRDVVSVYGDDIVLPRGTAALYIELLAYCGFKVNTDKSSMFGPFRESCGEDYWADERVVPIYLRDRPYLLPTDIYRVANTLPRVWFHDDIKRYLLQSHKGRSIVYGLPVRDSSVCWFTSLDHLKATRMVRWNADTQSWRQRIAKFVPKGRDPGELAGYAAALLGSKIHIDPDWMVAKSVLRRQGKWSLTRVSVG